MIIATEIEYEASPVDIAEEFLEMSVDEQADTLYIIASKLSDKDISKLSKHISDVDYKDIICEVFGEICKK